MMRQHDFAFLCVVLEHTISTFSLPGVHGKPILPDAFLACPVRQIILSLSKCHTIVFQNIFNMKRAGLEPVASAMLRPRHDQLENLCIDIVLVALDIPH